ALVDDPVREDADQDPFTVGPGVFWTYVPLHIKGRGNDLQHFCYFLADFYAAFGGFRRLYHYFFPSEFFGKAHPPGSFGPFLWLYGLFGRFHPGGEFFLLFPGRAQFKKSQLVGTGRGAGKLLALFAEKVLPELLEFKL